MKAVLRRYEPKQEDTKYFFFLKFGEWKSICRTILCCIMGKSLDFPPKELNCSAFWRSIPIRYSPESSCLTASGAMNMWGDTRTVDVHVKRIREKLNSEDEWGIRTVWSVGYKFGQKIKGEYPFLYVSFQLFRQALRQEQVRRQRSYPLRKPLPQAYPLRTAALPHILLFSSAAPVVLHPYACLTSAA